MLCNILTRFLPRPYW